MLRNTCFSFSVFRFSFKNKGFEIYLLFDLSETRKHAKTTMPVIVFNYLLVDFSQWISFSKVPFVKNMGEYPQN